jgi:glycosyltransferase involved in cell wall biosynthesis
VAASIQFSYFFVLSIFDEMKESASTEKISHASAVIITLNAEKYLQRCLQALERFEEVILLDSGSNDRTLDIAKTFSNVRSFYHPFSGFGAQKNKAVSLASRDWIFSVDADEIADSKLIDAIADWSGDAKEVGLIKRINYYRDKPVEACGWQNSFIPRLFNRRQTAFLEKIVHEVIDTQESQLVRFPGVLHHYAFANPDELLRKIIFYSELYALENRFKKRVSRAAISWKTLFAFFRNYILLRGFTAGYEGLLISYSNASGVFYKYSKLYEMNNTISCSLIITTYNRPDALELVIRSAFVQTKLPVEIVVADDGSDERTADLITAMKKISPVPIKHVWHEDTGFRLSEIRNKAVAVTEGEYIVMVDGDMVLHRNFIQNHLHAAKPGIFIQGSRVLLNEKITGEALSKKNISFHSFHPGITNRLNAVDLPVLSRMVSITTKSVAGVRGANMSFWKSDLLAVNGFDNNFVGWGREDSEFCARMITYGVKRKNLKLGGVAFHLFHPESPRAKLSSNDHLLEQSIREKRIRALSGVDKFIS